MNIPYAVVYRLAGDPDWKLINLRLHADLTGAVTAAADWVRDKLRALGVDRDIAKSHVAGTRAAVRDNPGRPVTVTLPGHVRPLLHIMTVQVVIPAAEDAATTNENRA